MRIRDGGLYYGWRKQKCQVCPRTVDYQAVYYCYRPRSVVCRSVSWFAPVSVTLVSPTKTAEPIEMPFGLRIRVGPGNRVLDGVQIPHGKG